MDIDRIQNEKKLDLCQWYFRGKIENIKSSKTQSLNEKNKKTFFINFYSAGFAFLPFVWVINVAWFFDSAFRKPPFDEQNAIRKCKNLHFNNIRFMTHFNFRPQMWYSRRSVLSSGSSW